MATVTQVVEAREPRLSTVSLSGKRVFHVYFDEFSNYKDMINLASSAVDPSTGLKVPQEGTDFDGNKWSLGEAVCTDIVCELFEEQNMIWQVSCSFSAPETQTRGDAKDPVDYPWQQPKLTSYSHSFAERLLGVDLDGNAILNSAGDNYEQVITRGVPIRRKTITYNAKSFNASNATRKLGKLSDSDKTLCVVFDGQEQVFTNPNTNKKTKYWSVTEAYDTITSRDSWDTWQGMIQDVGLMCTRTSDGKRRPATDSYGHQAVSPVPLNGDGLELTKPDGQNRSIGNGGKSPLSVISGLSDSGNGVWLRYKLYE